MDFEYLPESIFYKIINFSLSIEECDINGNLNLKLVNKYWYKKINTIKFWKDYSKIIHYNIYSENSKKESIYSHYKNVLNLRLQKHIDNVLSSKKSDKYINEKLYLEKKLFYKQNFNKETILDHHEFFYLYQKINEDIYETFPEDIVDIPVCYFKNSSCIDNLCDWGCAENYHNLLKYANNFIMRGVDDLGRFYLLFFYKNNVTNRIYHEFVFPINFVHNNNKITLFTYSGEAEASYIGNLSFNQNYLANTPLRYFNRKLNYKSYNYMKRLLNFEPCGFVFYDSESNSFIESKKIHNNKPVVELFFDKKEIQKKIEYNFCIS